MTIDLTIERRNGEPAANLLALFCAGLRQCLSLYWYQQTTVPLKMNPQKTMASLEPDQPAPSLHRLDAQALAEVHDRYYPVVYRYVAYRLEDPLAVEDIVSEVFLGLLNALQKRGSEIRDLRAWLLGAAHNQVQDLLRKKYRRNTAPLEDVENLPNHQLPEADVDGRLQRQTLQRLLGRLTDDQQHVLALRFSQELSVDDTARMMGKSVSAVKVLQFRALAALRRLLEEK